MTITKKAQAYHDRMFLCYESKLLKSDPELVELFDNFAFDEVVNQDDLDDHTRMLAILASLVGCQGIDEFKAMLTAAYRLGVSAIEMKEIVYQGVAYLGIGRVFPFIHAINDFCISKEISLPLEGQSTTNGKNRLEKGIQAQVDIFGEHMRNFYNSGSSENKHINYWLTANCFGDYYTRNGLDYNQREMITFCFLTSLGGCEPQLKAHISANIHLGNDAQFLIKIVSQCIPFIGYPRSLNTLQCIKEIEDKEIKK